MDNIIPFLSEWTFNYIKNKDLITKKIENIEEYMNKSYIFVKYKDKNQVFFIEPEITDIGGTLGKINSAKKETGSDWSSLVVLNSLNNLKAVQDNWKDLSKDGKFTIIFINPHSILEKKWIISPYVHSKIIEPKDLRQGLKAMFDSVEQTSLDTLKNRIKQ